MTVRVNKQPFNLREKLSELEKPIGLKGSELMKSETAQDARDLVSAGRKNMIINGDMRISQRHGTTATTTGNGTFVIDRYRCEVGAGGATTMQQVTDAPVGFHNSMKITVTGTDTSVAAGDFHYIRHIIEGNNMNHLNWGSSNAKPVTLSFWVKSSVTGSHGGSLWNNAFNRSFPFNYSINSADTWEHKSITIPGCPDGTWESGISRGINIGFIQLAGSNFTGPPDQWNSAGDVGPTTLVNLLATSGATWYITGIQLEVGKNATDFEHRTYGEELALCMRYYEKFSGDCGNGGYATFMMCSKNSNTYLVAQPVFRVPKRAPGATLTFGGLMRMSNVEEGEAHVTLTGVNNYQLGIHGGYMVLVISSNSHGNGDAFRLEARGDTTSYMAFQSEL
jgi:hypothetical protein